MGTVIMQRAGMEPGTATAFATTVASATGIGAPAKIRADLPEANVGRCLSASPCVRFPYNPAIGVPLYAMATSATGR